MLSYPAPREWLEPLCVLDDLTKKMIIIISQMNEEEDAMENVTMAENDRTKKR
jgi:hypothetical protein